MKNLPLGVRLFLNVLVFSVPIVVLTYLMYKSETVNIEFGQKELLGNKLQKPYIELFKQVVQHKLNPDSSNLTSINESFDKLSKTYEELAETLQFTEEGLASRKRESAKIDILKGYLANKKWDDALASIKTGVAQLGDTSNLILDPDLDSYYLMDITLLALPQMQDRLQTILSNSEQFFEKELSLETKIQAALFASMLEESDLNRVLADSQTVLNEDKNFYEISKSLQANIPVMNTRLKSKVSDFIQVLRQIANSGSVDKSQFYKLGNLASAESFDSWFTSANELDILLNKRVETLSENRKKALSMAGMALLFALMFSVLVGVSLSQSIKNLLNSILQLKETASAALNISDDLNQTSQNVAKSTMSQSSALVQTAASVDEISSMVSMNADNTKLASELAFKASDSASQGEQELDNLIKSMNEISKSSKKIVDTISVIDDIAFQTNLLALNASVEAARAGEQGKGFAVVAEAVRNLAQKSAQSAKEINQLVNENVSVIQSGHKGASNSAEILKHIIDSIKKLNALNSEIATATNEQLQGINQISKAISELESVSHTAQSDMGTVTESAQSLFSQSQQLDKIISILESEILGKKAEKNVSPN